MPDVTGLCKKGHSRGLFKFFKIEPIALATDPTRASEGLAPQMLVCQNARLHRRTAPADLEGAGAGAGIGAGAGAAATTRRAQAGAGRACGLLPAPGRGAAPGSRALGAAGEPGDPGGGSAAAQVSRRPVPGPGERPKAWRGPQGRRRPDAGRAGCPRRGAAFVPQSRRPAPRRAGRGAARPRAPLPGARARGRCRPRAAARPPRERAWQAGELRRSWRAPVAVSPRPAVRGRERAVGSGGRAGHRASRRERRSQSPRSPHDPGSQAASAGSRPAPAPTGERVAEGGRAASEGRERLARRGPLPAGPLRGAAAPPPAAGPGAAAAAAEESSGTRPRRGLSAAWASGFLPAAGLRDGGRGSLARGSEARRARLLPGRACGSRGKEEGSGPAAAAASEPFCRAIVRQAEAAARPGPAAAEGPPRVGLRRLGRGAAPLWPRPRPRRAVRFVLSGAERGPAPACRRGEGQLGRGGGGRRGRPAAPPHSPPPPLPQRRPSPRAPRRAQPPRETGCRSKWAAGCPSVTLPGEAAVSLVSHPVGAQSGEIPAHPTGTPAKLETWRPSFFPLHRGFQRAGNNRVCRERQGGLKYLFRRRTKFLFQW